MKKVVAKGAALAHPDLAHSVHVEVGGLDPQREYFYRFHAGAATIRDGRALTWPTPRAPGVDRVKFALASCSHYEQGYFTAYRDMAAMDPAFIVHVGDYIYETSWGTTVRHAPVAEARTLQQFRLLHGVYKTDPDLQAAHAHCPWLYMWDDHEVANDYSRDESERIQDHAAFMKVKAAGYQAAYEHMPLRISAKPRDGQAVMYQRLNYGDLAEFAMLDLRQNRDPIACQTPTAHGGRLLDARACPELDDPNRTMLGAVQEKWFSQNFGRVNARWNVIVQTLMLAALDQMADPAHGVYTDNWGGYPFSRRKILDLVKNRRIPNVISLGGDIHSFFVSEIRDDDHKLSSPVLINEFVGTSVTSESFNTAVFQSLLPKNPQVKFCDDRYRGYVLCDVGRNAWQAHLRAVDNVRVRDGKATTLKSFAIENGNGALQAG
jgi:alkaline phosphatase D